MKKLKFPHEKENRFFRFRLRALCTKRIHTRMVSLSVASLSSPLLSKSSKHQSSLKRTTVSRRTTPTTKRRRVVGGGCSLSLSSSSSSSLRRVKAFVAKTTTLTILYLTVMGGFVPTTTNDFAMAMGGDDGTTTTTVRTENASVFNGKYSDPNHPGCLRGIERVRSTTKAKVFGEDGTPGCQADGQKETKKWELEGELRGENEILIDFSKKGGPKNLLGKWTGSGVLFPDGNTWSKL